MSDLPSIGAPATRALASIGVTSLEQAAAYTSAQLLALHGFGPMALRLVEAALADRGLALAAAPVLLSGGNPQIAKGEGDGPVQAYIAALPGWKREAGERLDRLITEAVPEVRKAVKWNSPFYGIEGHGWIVSFHAITKYLKVGFFAGSSLVPEPPFTSKDAGMRYVHLFEDGELDEDQFRDWVRQAARLPGWLQ